MAASLVKPPRVPWRARGCGRLVNQGSRGACPVLPYILRADYKKMPLDAPSRLGQIAEEVSHVCFAANVLEVRALRHPFSSS